jgi:uncharacterized protein (DUF1778 family)
VPLVIDATTTPVPGHAGGGPAGAELLVLATLTGALNLDQDSARRLVLAGLARVDESKRKSYTVFVLNAASAAARQALEDLMTTTQFSDPFIDRFIAEGEAKGQATGEARMVLRVLSARGLSVPEEIRQRVLSCTDTGQLEAWGERAATADALDDVFSS